MPASTVKVTKAIDVGIYQHHDARISHNIVVQHEGEIGNGLSLMARHYMIFFVSLIEYKLRNLQFQNQRLINVNINATFSSHNIYPYYTQC